MSSRIRSVLVGGLAVVGIAMVAIAPGAVADGPLRCEVLAVSMGPQPHDVPNRPEKDAIVVRWEGPATMTVACPGMPVTALDVWEHAYYVISPGGPVRGRIELRMGTPTGTVTFFRGRARGTSECDDEAGTCTLQTRLHAVSEDGDRLALERTEHIVVGDTVETTGASGALVLSGN